MSSVPFHEALEDCSRLAGKVPQASCLLEGEIPVIGQGKQAIEGFTNDSDLVFRGSLPVILFGDHTAVFKFIDYPFARGADGTKLFRPRSDRLDARYAWHFLQTIQLPQTGYDRKTKYLESISIPLPPLEEQRRIAAILDKAGHLNRLSTLFDSLRLQAGKSLYLSLFGDPIANPYGLPSQKIGEMAHCQLGKMLDKKRQHGNSRRPYLRNANVRWFDVSTDDCLYMDIEESEMDRFGVLQGDLLVCEGGEPGRSAIWKGESGVYGFQKALHRIRPKNDIVTPQFLNWSFWILAQRGLLSDHITSATIAHLTREKLVNIDLLLPPIALQKRFVQCVDQIEAVFALSAPRQKRLQSLRMSLFSEFLV